MKKLIYLFLVASIAWFVFLKNERVTLGPGLYAPDGPEQVMIENPESFPFEGYVITPLAGYEVRAKVLAKENYYLGRESDLSPSDLALGWGNMSDERTLESIRIQQSSRWYHWYTDKLPIPGREMAWRSPPTWAAAIRSATLSYVSRRPMPTRPSPTSPHSSVRSRQAG